MLANFFETSKPINFIAILGLFLVYYFSSLFSVFSITDFTTDFILKQVLILLIFLIIFFLFNFINTKNKLTQENHSYTFLIFVCLLGNFNASFFDLKNVIICALSLLLFRKIFILKNLDKGNSKMFDAGFWIGIIFILEPFFLSFFIFLFVAISLFRTLNYRTILIPLVGFISPLIIYFSYCFFYDNTSDFIVLFSWYTNYDFSFYLKKSILIPTIILISLTVFALLVKSPKKLSISGNERKKWILYIVQFLVSVLFILLLKNKNGSEFLIAFFPMAFLITNWFEFLKSKLIKNIILFLLVLLPFMLLII